MIARSKKYTKDDYLLLDKERDVASTITNPDQPVFLNNGYSWYIDRYFQNYLENEQAENLPRLNGYGCFKVTSKEGSEYVLINHKQQVLAVFNYNAEGKDQMQARINIMKVSKHFDDYEKNDI